MIELDVLTLALLTGTVIPVLVGLVTKAEASSTVKGVANIVLSFAGGALTFLATNSGSAPWQEVASAGLATWVVSGTAFHNLLKPVGVIDLVEQKTGTFGVGKVKPARSRTRTRA